MLERQRRDGLALFVVSANAAEADDRADIGAAFRQRRDLSSYIEIGFLASPRLSDAR